VKGNLVASKKTCRLIAISAFAIAAATGPVIAATTPATSQPQNEASPGKCLAWFGNQDDGKCLGYSNGQPINAGSPGFGAGNGPGGVGVYTGPLAPGTTFTGP
jgi:hypothetical protein